MKVKKIKRSSILFITFLILFSLKAGAVKAANLPSEYNINLIFNEKEKTLQAVQKVNIKNDLDTELKEIVFHLYADSYNDYSGQPLFGRNPKDNKKISEEERGDIQIKKVLVNDSEVRYTEDNQVLKITLKQPLKKNENIQVYIEFKLKMPKGTGRLGYTGDVYSLTNWYPILSMYDTKENKWDENPFHPIGESNYSDVANYKIDIKVPSNFVVVSTGEEMENEKNKESKTVTLEAKDVRDFVIFMSPYYEVISKEVDGIKVNSYYIKGKESNGEVECAKQVLDIAADAVKFFNNNFGKYPYKGLDIMETYLSGGAMEYPEAIQMGKYNNGYLEMDDIPFILEAAVHEVGHQWWYVTVGNNEFKEPFLDEALTSFSTAYYFEKTFGEYSPKSIAADLRYIFVDIDNNSNIKSNKISSSVDKFKEMYEYNITIYKKGALVFEDLRKRVGEKKFIEIMQEYFKTYKFENATIDGFLKIIEEKSGKEVKMAIEKAINGEKYVPENIRLSAEEGKKVDKERRKGILSKREKSLGMSISSIILRGLKDEKIIIVKPSNISDKETSSLNNLSNFIKDNFYGVDENLIIIKEDKDIKEEDIKNNNLIVLGNSWNNKLFNCGMEDLPITVTKKGIYSEDLILKGDDMAGVFICSNPKNSNKLVLSLFWTKSIPESINVEFESPDNIIVKMKDDKYYRGRI